jgi:predicted transcriptional regulator
MMRKIIQINKCANSINVVVIQRILTNLAESGSVNLTRLAMHSGLNFNTCKRYSNLMKILRWVEIKYERKNIVIHLTESGKKINNDLKFVN